ncbi:hypothetical protein KBC79_00855 [Candidatus Woesebacteria bacterium]|nr:hypothetical protein [Candidatus Woesebacteria bacterium]
MNGSEKKGKEFADEVFRQLVRAGIIKGDTAQSSTVGPIDLRTDANRADAYEPYVPPVAYEASSKCPTCGVNNHAALTPQYANQEVILTFTCLACGLKYDETAVVQTVAFRPGE